MESIGVTFLNRRDMLITTLALAGFSPRSVAASGKALAGRPLFRDRAAETGLDCFLYCAPTLQHYMPEIIGAGVALFDYDNDGDLDIYVLQDGPVNPNVNPLEPPPPGWRPGNRLYRNMLSETGKLQFVDVTEKAGVGNIGIGMGVAVGDYDNDGYQDLYVTNFGHNILYHNNGDGTFTDVTNRAGVDDPRWSTSAAWVDYDGDGLLDLFVCNYVDFTVADNKRCYAPAGELDYCSPRSYNPQTSRLFHNLGNGKFEDVTASSGIGSLSGYGLGVICADFDGDGRVDIYVANDSAANYLWLNQGNGTFKEGALEAGLAYCSDGLAKAGMGLAADDIDNDGHLEVIVTNLTGEGVTLFRSDGKGLYDDATAQYRLAETTFGYTGYGVGFFDYDNDGLMDLFIANGAMTIIESVRAHQKGFYPYAQKNQLFHNAGAGKGFSEVTGASVPDFNQMEVSRGAAFGDINNDGAVDLVVTNANGPMRVLINEGGAHGHWLLVHLESDRGNRFGMGAEVGVFRRGQPAIWRRAHTDGSMLSASDIRVHFGLGNHSWIDALAVHWPDGTKEQWKSVRADRIVTLKQGTGRSV